MGIKLGADEMKVRKLKGILNGEFMVKTSSGGDRLFFGSFRILPSDILDMEIVSIDPVFNSFYCFDVVVRQ